MSESSLAAELDDNEYIIDTCLRLIDKYQGDVLSNEETQKLLSTLKMILQEVNL